MTKANNTNYSVTHKNVYAKLEKTIKYYKLDYSTNYIITQAIKNGIQLDNMENLRSKFIIEVALGHQIESPIMAGRIKWSTNHKNLYSKLKMRLVKSKIKLQPADILDQLVNDGWQIQDLEDMNSRGIIRNYNKLITV